MKSSTSNNKRHCKEHRIKLWYVQDRTRQRQDKFLFACCAQRSYLQIRISEVLYLFACCAYFFAWGSNVSRWYRVVPSWHVATTHKEVTHNIVTKTMKKDKDNRYNIVKTKTNTTTKICATSTIVVIVVSPREAASWHVAITHKEVTQNILVTKTKMYTRNSGFIKTKSGSGHQLVV